MVLSVACGKVCFCFLVRPPFPPPSLSSRHPPVPTSTSQSLILALHIHPVPLTLYHPRITRPHSPAPIPLLPAPIVASSNPPLTRPVPTSILLHVQLAYSVLFRALDARCFLLRPRLPVLPLSSTVMRFSPLTSPRSPSLSSFAPIPSRRPLSPSSRSLTAASTRLDTSLSLPTLPFPPPRSLSLPALPFPPRAPFPSPRSLPPPGLHSSAPLSPPPYSPSSPALPSLPPCLLPSPAPLPSPPFTLSPSSIMARDLDNSSASAFIQPRPPSALPPPQGTDWSPWAPAACTPSPMPPRLPSPPPSAAVLEALHLRATFEASGAYPNLLAANPRAAFRNFEAAARATNDPAALHRGWWAFFRRTGFLFQPQASSASGAAGHLCAHGAVFFLVHSPVPRAPYATQDSLPLLQDIRSAGTSRLKLRNTTTDVNINTTTAGARFLGPRAKQPGLAIPILTAGAAFLALPAVKLRAVSRSSCLAFKYTIFSARRSRARAVLLCLLALGWRLLLAFPLLNIRMPTRCACFSVGRVFFGAE
ncbi:hypothetical protein DFH09DRAFT_1423788 [Mycena vulgaris]|nr:hypothetical protein DFH09DRAFT_1423788 [Mycena vulgaris]